MHHITEHGYAELPVRVSSILDELERTDLFERVQRRHFGDKHILAVHDARFVSYFRDVAMSIEPDRTIFPDVFPIRRNVGQPRKLASHLGYYCIDVYSPINRNAYLAARDAVDAALTAARAIETGSDIAYALVRPPGHHAGRDSFGGYCYFNSTAIAAH
ncbi:MAG: acetylpolyamine amidohydrolase, partial [Gammaproteobacteria bacterium]|nr:acetylpolyamine amidohydrolase [Gammaproteobacteria bacterium]